jgi:hypothetical protein
VSTISAANYINEDQFYKSKFVFMLTFGRFSIFVSAAKEDDLF